MAQTNDIKNIHPYLQYKNSEAEEEVMILDNITAAPIYGEANVTDDMLIIVCHRGTSWNERHTLEAHDVSVLLPHEIMNAKFTSEDFLHTLVILSPAFVEKLKHAYPYPRYTAYHRDRPKTHLTDEQFEFVNNALNILRVITKMGSRYRTDMLLKQISILFNVLGEFHVANYPDEVMIEPHMKFFNRFYESLTEHYAESHEVAFYAKMFDLTPKYFSALIKKETGVNAIKWISEYVIIQAKQLLRVHREYTVSQVSLALGFPDQSTFSRYFKKYTGMTPREYRDNTKNPNKNKKA